MWWFSQLVGDKPPVSVAPHFGDINQFGRPGPILSVSLEVERKDKGRHLVIVTPKAIERFHIDGTLAGRMRFRKESITVSTPMTIPGIGKVVAVGTQSGKLILFKSDTLTEILVINTTRDEDSTMPPRRSTETSERKLSAEEAERVSNIRAERKEEEEEGGEGEGLEGAEVTSVIPSCSFEENADMVFVANARGELKGWGVPTGAFKKRLVIPGESLDTYVSVMRTFGQEQGQDVWCAYGHTGIAIFNMGKGGVVDYLKSPDGLRVHCLSSCKEYMFGCTNLSFIIWCGRTRSALKTMPLASVIEGRSVTSIEAVECPKTKNDPASTIVVLGCSDGALAVMRLYVKGTKSHGPTLAREYCCVLVGFVPRNEDHCPITSIVIDRHFAAIFVGDASGVVYTVSNIKGILNNWSPMA